MWTVVYFTGELHNEYTGNVDYVALFALIYRTELVSRKLIVNSLLPGFPLLPNSDVDRGDLLSSLGLC